METLLIIVIVIHHLLILKYGILHSERAEGRTAGAEKIKCGCKQTTKL